MREKVLMFTLTLMVGLALGAICYHVLSAQQTPPTKAKGQTTKTIASLDVGPQIPELLGRYLRARVNTIEPGGYGAFHSHEDRPVFLYILEGTLTSCSPAGKCEELRENQAMVEGKDVTHWTENRGTRPARYLVVDISKEP
jgi:quercetin dioxygenase-like cupin family protein